MGRRGGGEASVCRRIPQYNTEAIALELQAQCEAADTPSRVLCGGYPAAVEQLSDLLRATLIQRPQCLALFWADRVSTDRKPLPDQPCSCLCRALESMHPVFLPAGTANEDEDPKNGSSCGPKYLLFHW